MKLLIETCLDDLYVALINNDKTIDYIHIKDLQKKSDELPFAVEKLLKNQKMLMEDINAIYVTKGPGSFMGVRAGLIFASTLAQVTKAKLMICDTLLFVSKGSREFWWDAKGHESYYFNPRERTTTLVEGYQESYVDYQDIVKHPMSYLGLFDEIKPVVVSANYLKEPSVG